MDRRKGKNTMNMTNKIEATIIETKLLRKGIDEQIQHLKIAEFTRRSRERSLAITKLQEAVMWLGMDLKDISDSGVVKIENPYPNSKDPTNAIIDPTADGLKL